MGRSCIKSKQGSLTVTAPAPAAKTAAAAANAAAAGGCMGRHLCWSPATYSSLASLVKMRQMQLCKARDRYLKVQWHQQQNWVPLLQCGLKPVCERVLQYYLVKQHWPWDWTAEVQARSLAATA